MFKLGEKGVIQFVVLLLLLGGLFAGYLLVNKYGTQFLNKAAPLLPTKPEASLELELEKSGEVPFSDEATPTSLAPNTKFRVDIYARSDVDEANLFVAKVKYTPETVELVEINKREGQSFVKNWVETSVDAGIVSMVGGVPAPGIKTDSKSGALLMGSIIFKTKASVTAKIELSDGNSAIYRNSDNTNVLSAVKGVIEVPIKEPQPTPSPTPVPTVICSNITVTGAIQGKNSAGQTVYIVESGAIAATLTANAKSSTGDIIQAAWKIRSFSNKLPNGGKLELLHPDNLVYLYTAPENKGNSAEETVVGVDVSYQGKSASCPDVKFSIKQAAQQPLPSSTPASTTNIDPLTKEFYDLQVKADITTQVVTTGGPNYFALTTFTIDGDRLTKSNITQLSGYHQRSQAPYADDQVSFTYQNSKFVSNKVKFWENNCIDLYSSNTKDPNKYLATFCYNVTAFDANSKGKTTRIYSYSGDPFIEAQYVGNKTGTFLFLTNTYNKNDHPIMGTRVNYFAIDPVLTPSDFGSFNYTIQAIYNGANSSDRQQWCQLGPTFATKYLRESNSSKLDTGTTYQITQNYSSGGCAFQYTIYPNVINKIIKGYLSLSRGSIPVSSPPPTPSPTPSSTPSTKPDLTIDKVDIVGTPTVGSNTNFSVVVKNIGGVAASHANSILLQIVITKPDDNALGSCLGVFNNLAAGSTATVELANCPKYTVAGQHKALVEVDPHLEGILQKDRIAESNENNNTSTYELIVEGGGSGGSQKGDGDGNKDGKIDLGDMSILLSDYNKETEFKPGIDLNGDNKINAFDFALLKSLLVEKKIIKS